MDDDKFRFSDGYVEYSIEIKGPQKRRRTSGIRIFFLLVSVAFITGSCVLAIRLTMEAIMLFGPAQTAPPQTKANMLQQSFLPETANARYGGFELNVANAAPNDGEMRYSEVYDHCAPSVVGVYTSFVGRTIEIGTGVIISADGIVLTCDHLLNGAENIDILFSDGTGASASVVARDNVSDLALIQFNSAGRTVIPAEFGDTVKVGDTLLLLGNPINRTLMLTDGLLSGKSDSANVNGYPMKVLMTNAQIEDGHSGAPLLNLYGQVVGIANSRLRISGSGTGSSVISFALPVETVKVVVDDLIEFGHISGRPSVGAQLGDIQSGYAAFMSLPQGAAVESVFDEISLLRSGDIIVEVNGVETHSVAELMSIVNDYAVGDEITVTVWRNRELFEVTLTLVEN
jgi:serine protease Do